MSFEGGYFSYLRAHLSDNQLDNLVKVSVNTVWFRNATCGGDTLYRTYPDSLIKRNTTNFYHSEQGKPAKIVFDMKGIFSITGIALKSTDTCAYLRTYKFQGSNNRNNWKDILYNSNGDLYRNFNWHSYSFAKVAFRYFRIFQSENQSLSENEKYYFALSGVDFIGSMLKIEKTCQRRAMRPFNYLAYIIIIS
jgi:hypothetical protein